MKKGKDVDCDAAGPEAALDVAPAVAVLPAVLEGRRGDHGQADGRGRRWKFPAEIAGHLLEHLKSNVSFPFQTKMHELQSL